VKQRVEWLICVAGAIFSWGVYGTMLHQGTVQLGSPLKALLCVGVAYFLLAIFVPVVVLSVQGGLSGFTMAGVTTATIAGLLGALGAVCIIFAFQTGALPHYVMPLVFGGAPIVSVLYAMALHPPEKSVHPLLYLGFLLAALGAGLVLYYRPDA
jgi:hypothetical protein